MWLDDLRPLTFGSPAANRRLSDDAFRPFGLSRIHLGGTEVAVREGVRAHLPFGQLRHFIRADAGRGRQGSGAARRRRVLVVAPIAGGYPFLMRDLVVALLGIADEVGITEWPNARYVPLAAGRFDFIDNCVETAQMVRAMAAEGTPGDGAPVHVVGVCQGAVPALASALLLAQEGAAPASLTLMGGPIDPSRNPTRLWRMLQGRSLDALEKEIIEIIPKAFPGAGRRVFPAWRQTDTFALYLWRQTMNGGGLPFQLAFDDGEDPWHYPLARLCWTLMDVTAEFFMGNVSTIFRDNALARGRLIIGGRRVQPEALSRTALLTVEGREDDISALTQTQAAQDLCVNVPDELRRHLVVPHAGHFALFYGQEMRRLILPAIGKTMVAGEQVAMVGG